MDFFREELAELTSETVVRHAECLVSQLFSYQAASEIPTDKNLLDTALVKVVGVYILPKNFFWGV